ncbi:MAG: polysaccharide deacetylase family protein [Pseudomonadota bacterium]
MPTRTRQRLLVVSIHDVMPETLPQTRTLFDKLRAAGLDRVTLLVVPGRSWGDDSLSALKQLVDDGAILAGHGWNHRVDAIRGWRHQLHSRLISRDVAEHLALDAAGIRDLVARCHAWFVEHELPVSDLYVPPAWAMGAISSTELAASPFRLFETFGGVLDTADGRFRRSAMVGFEADNLLRVVSCAVWNRLNLSVAGFDSPVRVAIHPNDLSLGMAKSLERLIDRGGRSLTYGLLAA